MKELPRLLDAGASDIELSLLRAGDADGPRDDARRAAMAAVGLSGASLLVSTSAVAASGARVAAAARFATWKWWLLGTVTSASLVGGGYWAATRAPRAEIKALASAAVAPAAPEPVGKAVISAEQPAPQESSAAALERPLGTPAARPAPAASAAGIEAQIELVDRARSAAVSGQARAALAALDDYQKRYPNGVLAQEAMLLRIESLLALGDRPSASRLGKAFLAQHPRSALAPRIRSLLGG